MGKQYKNLPCLVSEDGTPLDTTNNMLYNLSVKNFREKNVEDV